MDFNEIIEFIWFSYDFSKSARAGFFEKFGCENLRFLYVFVTSDLEISLRNWWFWKDFDMRARPSARDDFVVLFARDY